MVNHDNKNPSLKEMRDELRSLRKDFVKPVSRLRKADISSEIQRLKVAREETPAVSAVPSVPPQKYKAAVETVKEAKKAEFPVMPAGKAEAKGKAPKAAKAEEPEKKKVNKKDVMAKLMAMLEED